MNTRSANTTNRSTPRPSLGLIAKVALIFAIALTALTANASSASAATVAEVTGLQVEAPYVHRDTLNRKWIYAAGSSNSTASYPTQAALFQYYGGAWHKVGTTGSASGSYTNRSVGHVLCTGAMTNYSFYTRVYVKYAGTWYSMNSRVVTQSC